MFSEYLFNAPLPSRVLHALMFCNADLKHDMLVCFQYACRDQEDGGRWRKNICLSFIPQGLRGELSGGSGEFYPYLKPAPAWIKRMVHSSPTENRLFFFSSWYTITTSQQEVHGMGCKDSRFGSVLGQASWIWLFKGTFAWALSGGDTIERGDKQLHKSELNNSV